MLAQGGLIKVTTFMQKLGGEEIKQGDIGKACFEGIAKAVPGVR